MTILGGSHTQRNWRKPSVHAGCEGFAGSTLYFRSAPGDYVGAGETILLVPGLASFSAFLYTGSFYTSITTSDYSNGWSLNVTTADYARLGVGVYENAGRTFQTSQPGINFSGNGRSCGQAIGRFEILDLETDWHGTVTRIAVDFEQRCDSANAPPLLGSYRLNSSVPIRR